MLAKRCIPKEISFRVSSQRRIRILSRAYFPPIRRLCRYRCLLRLDRCSSSEVPGIIFQPGEGHGVSQRRKGGVLPVSWTEACQRDSKADGPPRSGGVHSRGQGASKTQETRFSELASFPRRSSAGHLRLVDGAPEEQAHLHWRGLEAGQKCSTPDTWFPGKHEGVCVLRSAGAKVPPSSDSLPGSMSNQPCEFSSPGEIAAPSTCVRMELAGEPTPLFPGKPGYSGVS